MGHDVRGCDGKAYAAAEYVDIVNGQLDLILLTADLALLKHQALEGGPAGIVAGLVHTLASVRSQGYDIIFRKR
jgi:hypothetical protein